jgi:hypothetical protein
MEQRPQARQDALNRVCSAVTQLVSLFVVKSLNGHAGFLRKISGQLRNLGSMDAASFNGITGDFSGLKNLQQGVHERMGFSRMVAAKIAHVHV